MNIILSDIRDGFIKSGIKNKMTASGESLVIKLSDKNLMTIFLEKDRYGDSYINYKIMVYQTGNVLESNRIDNQKLDNQCLYDKTYGRSQSSCDYESKDVFEVLPRTMEELLDVFNFFNEEN